MQTVVLNDKERWALDTQTPSTILWTTCFNFFFFFLNLYLLITLKSDQWAETGHQIMTELFWHFLFILHGTDWNRLTNSADRWLNEFKKHHQSIVMFMVIFLGESFSFCATLISPAGCSETHNNIRIWMNQRYSTCL